MADVFIFDGKLIVGNNNCVSENAHDLSVVKEELVELFDGQEQCKNISSADELVLCVWKASALRSTPLTGGHFVAANILGGCFLVSAPETSHSVLSVDKKLVTIFCSSRFCDVFRYSDGERVVLRVCEKVPDIEQVVLVAETEDCFIWASEESFRIAVRDFMSKRTLLVMEGCTFGSTGFTTSHGCTAMGEQLSVVNCVPSCQGRLTETSEIVVKCGTHKADICHRYRCMKCNSGHGDGSVKAVMVSDFAANVAGCSSPLTSLKSELRLNKSNEAVQAYKLKLTVLTDMERMKSRIPCQGICDEFSAVVFTKQYACKLGIMSGNVLEISCELHDSRGCGSRLRSSEQHRVCRSKVVVAFVDAMLSGGDEVPDACVSSCAWFNMCRKACLSFTGDWSTQSCHVKKLSRHLSDGQSCSRTQCVEDIPVASEAVVSCIHSPHYNAMASLDSLLCRHFTSPRLVETGDVFVVEINGEDCDTIQQTGDGLNLRRGCVYFEVKKLSSASNDVCTGPCFVNRQHTSLLLETAVNDYIPPCVYESHGSWKSSLTFLKKYVDEALRVLDPFLTDRSRCGQFRPVLLVSGGQGCGKTAMSRSLAAWLCFHHVVVNCHTLLGDTPAATEAKIRQCIASVQSSRPCVCLLHHVDVLSKDRDGSEDSRVSAMFTSTVTDLLDESTDWPVVVIATTTNRSSLTVSLHDMFVHCIEFECLTETERASILTDLLAGERCRLSADVSVTTLAQQCPGIVLADLCSLVCYAKHSAYRRHAKDPASHQDIFTAAAGLEISDFESALELLQTSQSDALGAPKIPRVTWDDVGGLADVKRDILETIRLPLLQPQLLACGLRRSGILLYGPPGTGKTLLAKAVATECSLNFLSVKGPELLNMYVGQSEENVREVFSRARTASPCVIFFDELDSLAPNRGRSGDSGGVMDRVVSQLLAEIDGLNKSTDVFVVGATNRPDLLDPALLRPGRFDKLVYLGVSSDKESQMKIITALTRKFRLSSDCHLENVVERCPFNMTGADFYALCSDSMLSAITRTIASIDSDKPSSPQYQCSDAASDADSGVIINEEDFYAALSRLVPSMSAAELKRYDRLREMFTHGRHGNGEQQQQQPAASLVDCDDDDVLESV